MCGLDSSDSTALHKFILAIEATKVASEVKSRAWNEVAADRWSLSHVPGAVIDECGASVVMTGVGNHKCWENNWPLNLSWE